VTLRGRLPREGVRDHLARCRALVMPGEEDFGLTPLEANASGRPVIAYRAGGALETVVEGRTGWFFDAQTPESLMPVLERVAVDMSLRAHDLCAHARRFDVSAFRTAVLGVLRAARAGQYGVLDAA
jgi:glycosyltransferase involved in cell wall biosynthesis